jgi:hypothetical protein
MIPLHRDTVATIFDFLEASMTAPSAICGYPIPGWMLDSVSFDERKGEPDGWVVSLKRERDNWMLNKRSFVVVARSDIGPLEAWDEALKIAQREDAREAERAVANGETPNTEESSHVR